MEKNLRNATVFFLAFLFFMVGCGSGGGGNGGGDNVNYSGKATVKFNTQNSNVIGDTVIGSFEAQDPDSEFFTVTFTSATSPSGKSLLPVSWTLSNESVNRVIQKLMEPAFWGFIPNEAGTYNFNGYVSDTKGGRTPFEFYVIVKGLTVSATLNPGSGPDADYVLKLSPNSTSPAQFDIYWIKGEIPDAQIAEGDRVEEGFSEKEYNLGKLLPNQIYTCRVIAYNNPAQCGDKLSTTFYKVFTTPSFNRPPIVELGEAREMQVGTGITLAAVSASDPDGDDLTYLWTTTAGGTFDNASLATPQFTANTAGACTVKLTLTDAKGASASDTADITVTPAPVPDPNTVIRNPNNYQVFPTFVVGYDFVIKKTEGVITGRNLPALFSADAQASFGIKPLAFVGDCNEWDPNTSDYLQIDPSGTVVVKISDHDANPGTKGFNFSLISGAKSNWFWALDSKMKPADVKMLMRPRNDGSVAFGYKLFPNGSIDMVAEGATTN